jgi:hypothetical protein
MVGLLVLVISAEAYQAITPINILQEELLFMRGSWNFQSALEDTS